MSRMSLTSTLYRAGRLSATLRAIARWAVRARPLARSPLHVRPALLRMETAVRLKNVQNVNPDIKAAVLASALERGVTMRDVAGEILAKKYGMTYSLSGEKSMGSEGTGTQLLLMLPEDIIAAVWLESRETKLTESGVIQLALSDHFGIAYTPAKRRGGRRKVA